VTIEHRAALEPIAAEWDELADRARAVPWVRPGWAAAWHRAFGRGALDLVTLRRDGRLAGVAAMERRRGELRALSNWHTPSFGLLAEDDEAAAELAHALMGPGSRRVALPFLRREGDGLGELRAAAAAAGRRVIVRPLERSPYVAVDGDFAAYEERLETKVRSELRRRRRRLEEEGELRLEVHDGSERLEELVAEGLAVEAAAWKGEQGTAILSDPATKGFYEDIARWGAARGGLRLAFLRLDGRPLAFDFAWEEQGVHYLLKTGYDPDYRKLAPGMLIRHGMLERAFSHGLTSYEFLGDDNPWKREWTTTFRELKLLQAFAPSPAGAVDWTAWAVGRPLARAALARVRG
jgi:CelD/BcsL family acetyltransferase involved in cellulose biosynthesis